MMSPIERSYLSCVPSQMEFKNLVSDWVLDTKAGETEEKFPWKTTQDEMELLKDKV